MKNITVTDCKRKLTLDDISQLERELEVILPSDYKEFLFKHNGGHPVKNCFCSRDDDYASSSINIFIHMLLKIYYTDIVGEYGLFKDRIPVDFIPIADDPGGNLICLGVGKNFGKVYFWDHEEEADGDFGEEPSFNNMYLIADKFR
jgi:hypothetical protein